MTMRTALVPREEILDLRWRVLRPGLPRESADFPEDADPATFHVAAYHGDAPEVLACVTVFPDRFPHAVGHGSALGPGPTRPAHRFRGMASAPAARGRGYGAAVLRAATDEAAARGAELLWCNARSEARGFYERHGFTAVGEKFLIEGVGPHHVMARRVTVSGVHPA